MLAGLHEAVIKHNDFTTSLDDEYNNVRSARWFSQLVSMLDIFNQGEIPIVLWEKKPTRAKQGEKRSRIKYQTKLLHIFNRTFYLNKKSPPLEVFPVAFVR